VTGWETLVGQPAAVATFRAAVTDALREPAGPAMTHAWLITGPPGSGRSVAARLFAAALACPTGGCGTCPDCRDTANGAHPDVTVITPEGLSYRTSDARLLADRAAYSPARSRWHVIVLEDADRLTEAANNVLLKSIEEPPPRTVWVLCAPGVEDVLPTIHSRCRQVRLRTPSSDEVARHLTETDGIDARTALFAARAAQGHVGRARALAVVDDVRRQRQFVLGLPRRLTTVIACFEAAAEIVDLGKQAAEGATSGRDEREQEELNAAWGEGAQGKGVRGGARGRKGAMKELETRQSSRRTRTQRDELDRMMLDLLSYYRDVLVIQTGAAGEGPGGIELVNDELAGELGRMAAEGTLTETMLRLEAIEQARRALAANVAPQLALEALMVELWDPTLRAKLHRAG